MNSDAVTKRGASWCREMFGRNPTLSDTILTNSFRRKTDSPTLDANALVEYRMAFVKDGGTQEVVLRIIYENRRKQNLLKVHAVRLSTNT
jgi:hypothetical protein